METATCGQCGEVIPADTTRCPACGTPLQAGVVGVPKEANPDIVEPPPTDPTATPRGERRTAAGLLGVGIVAALLLWVLVSPVWAGIGLALAVVVAGVVLYM